MDFVTRIFGEINPRFLARSYLLGAIIFAIMTWLSLRADGNLVHVAPTILLGIVSTALFPFSKMVWNSTRDFLRGDTIIFTNVLFLFPAKFAVNLLLWMFAVFVAPIGVLFLARRASLQSGGNKG
jgi:hypothetical protein